MREGTGNSSLLIPLPELAAKGCVCVCPYFRCVLLVLDYFIVDTLQFHRWLLCFSCELAPMDFVDTLLSALCPVFALLPVLAIALDCRGCKRTYDIVGLWVRGNVSR